MMGYYLNNGLPKIGKVEFIQSRFGAQKISADEIPSWRALSTDKILIAVVENGFFDAALVCVDQNEHNFIVKTMPTEKRPVTLFLMDRETAYENCGYTKLKK